MSKLSKKDMEVVASKVLECETEEEVMKLVNEIY